jgi:hypothetical protein
MSSPARNFIIAGLAILIIGIGAWYAFTQSGGAPSSQPVTAVQTPMKTVPEPVVGQATSSVVVVATSTDAQPECQKIEDAYAGPVFIGSSPEWILRTEKYPIAKKYASLKTNPDAVGEGGDDLVARLFTAADCGTEQTERFLGTTVDQKVPFAVRFDLKNPPKIFLDLLKSRAYEQVKQTSGSPVQYVINPANATYQDVLNLKPYASYMANILEQG